METELQAKHQTKKKITREIKQLTNQLKRTVNIIIFNAIVYKLDVAVKSRLEAVKKRHDKKRRMFKVLVVLFITKLYARTNIF